MACGIPTVAANRTSLPEVVGDGGLLVAPDPGPLAAAIASVLNDPALAAALGARGLARAAYHEAAGNQPSVKLGSDA